MDAKYHVGAPRCVGVYETISPSGPKMFRISMESYRLYAVWPLNWKDTRWYNARVYGRRTLGAKITLLLWNLTTHRHMMVPSTLLISSYEFHC